MKLIVLVISTLSMFMLFSLALVFSSANIRFGLVCAGLATLFATVPVVSYIRHLRRQRSRNNWSEDDRAAEYLTLFGHKRKWYSVLSIIGLLLILLTSVIYSIERAVSGWDWIYIVSIICHGIPGIVFVLIGGIKLLLVIVDEEAEH